MRLSHRVVLSIAALTSACRACETKASSTKLAGHDAWEARMESGGGSVPTAAVVDGVVVVGDGFNSTSLVGLDAKTGKERWRTALEDNGAGPATAFDDSVAFTTESCTLYVADARSGAVRWSKWLGDPLVSHPAVASHVVYVVAPTEKQEAHALYAFDAADGHERWRAVVGADAMGSPVVVDDRVYVATQDGTLTRFTTKGDVVWSISAGATSAPVAGSAGELFVVAQERSGEDFVEGVRRVNETGNAPTMSPLWHARPSSRRADESSVEVGGERFGGALHHLGTEDIETLWSWQGGRPAIAGGRLFALVGDELAAFDATGGQVLWTVRLAQGRSRENAPPVAFGSQVFLATAAGALEVRDAATGVLAEAIPLGSPAAFPPVVAGDRIVVSTTDGRVESIALSRSH